MATTSKTILTAEEFLEHFAGRGAFELVNGEVVNVSPGNVEHGIICFNVGSLLREYGQSTGYGYVTGADAAVLVSREPDTVRGADVAFYSEARLPRKSVGSGLVTVPPDLVVEVFSPSDRSATIRSKINEYLLAGVLMVWVVYPARREVGIYRADEPIPIVLHENDVLEQLPELPGFHCRVADFFV